MSYSRPSCWPALLLALACLLPSAMLYAAAGSLTINYYRSDATMDGWKIQEAGTRTEARFTGETAWGSATLSLPETASSTLQLTISGPALDGCKTTRTVQWPDHLEVWFSEATCKTYLSATEAENDSIPANMLRIHYLRPDGNYAPWSLYLWEANEKAFGEWGSNTHAFEGKDAFGGWHDFDVRRLKGDILGAIIHQGERKDHCGQDLLLDTAKYREVWIVSGECAPIHDRAEAEKQRLKYAGPPADLIRIHYYRLDNDYRGWALYLWGEGNRLLSKSWADQSDAFDRQDRFGAYRDINLNRLPSGTSTLGILVHNQDEKDLCGDIRLDTAKHREFWFVSSVCETFTTRAAALKARGQLIHQNLRTD